MRENACRLALAVVLTALLAPPAGGCLLRLAVHYQKLFEGPLPAAGGGAWFAHAQDDGSVVALRVGDDGSALDEVVLRADGLRLGDEPWVDGEGRFWLQATRPDGETRALDHRLALFDAGGRLLADDELRGGLLGVDSGVAHLLATSPDEEPDPALEVWHQDPLSGHAVLAFSSPLGRDELRSSALAGDGAVWLLTLSPVHGADREPIAVLRRLSPGGTELAAWRLAGGGLRPYTFQLHPGRDGAVLLAGTLDGEASVWTLDGSGVAARRRLPDAGDLGRVAPLAGGGLLLRVGPEAVRLDGDGDEAGRFPVAAVASWAGWEDAARQAAAARLAAAGDRPTPELIEALAHVHGADAERATARLLAAGPRAADLLVAWHARLPEEFRTPAAGSFVGGSGHGALVDHLIEEMMAADPDAVGEHVTALLPGLDADLRRRFTSRLIQHWARPSASFVAMMEEGLASDDEEVRSSARSAFLAGGPGDRFPVSRDVFRFFLAELVDSHERSVVEHVGFFLARFPEVAASLDAVLADPDHPARPAALAWLRTLPRQLLPRTGRHRLLEQREEAAGGGERALARWANRWAAADDAELAAAARGLAVAAGAVVAATNGGEEKVAELVLDGPDLFPGWREQAIGGLYGNAPPEVRAALFARLAEPALPADARRAVAGLFRPGTEADAGVGPEVAARVAATPGLFADLQNRDGDLLPTFVAFLWQQLEGRHAERGRLEAAFRDACTVETAAAARQVRDHDQGGVSWPTSCLRWAAASDVGRLVPAELLSEQVALYRRPDWSVRLNYWLPVLVELEARRGPLPGLAELIRRELVAAPDPKVDRDLLAAALGDGGLPAVYREVSALPPLDLAAQP